MQSRFPEPLFGLETDGGNMTEGVLEHGSLKCRMNLRIVETGHNKEKRMQRVMGASLVGGREKRG
jgi:hypothetical protein